jgi:hypothetical protein
VLPNLTGRFGYCEKGGYFCSKGRSQAFFDLDFIPVQLDGHVEAFDPVAGHAAFAVKVKWTEYPPDQLDIEADLHWNSTYQYPPELPVLTGRWLLVPTEPIDPEAVVVLPTLGIQVEQSAARITGQGCDAAFQCAAPLTGYLSAGKAILNWSSIDGGSLLTLTVQREQEGGPLTGVIDGRGKPLGGTWHVAVQPQP